MKTEEPLQSGRVTMKQISAELSLSRTTVYRVLQNSPRVDPETRRRVLEAIERYDYRPNALAQNLARKRAGAIGIVTDALASPVWDTLIEQIIWFFNQDSYSANLRVGARVPYDLMNQYIDDDVSTRRIDGLVMKYSYPFLDHTIFEKTRAKILGMGFPIVFLTRVPDRDDVSFVSTDREAGMYSGAKHLFDAGRRRVLMATVQEDYIPSRRMGKHKEHGFLRAARDAGMGNPDDLLVIGRSYDYAGGLELAKRIAAMRPLPDGVVCTNDVLAVAIVNVLIECGIGIPDDVAVIGFNNEPQCEFSPVPLTTVAQPTDEIGTTAHRIITEKLDDPQRTAEQILIVPELVVRDSA